MKLTVLKGALWNFRVVLEAGRLLEFADSTSELMLAALR